jgi:hypothetical protein
VRREQLEHVVRAEASIVGVADVVAIGSQAILASVPDWNLPAEATRSVEADIAVDVALARLDEGLDESELADQIDGAIGEASMFQQTHGYYAQGVETSTAVLPEGWRDRLVPLVCEDAEPKVVGWCLEPNDLWVSKAAASREKDLSFCRALATAGHVDRETCQERARDMSEPHRARVETVLLSSFGSDPSR